MCLLNKSMLKIFSRNFCIIFLQHTHHDPLCLVLLLFTFQSELNKQLLQFFITVIDAELFKTTERKRDECPY